MNSHPHVPIPRFHPDLPAERAAERFARQMHLRRSCRFFADTPVSLETIEWCVRAAGSAPSGANKQPWRFVCVSDSTIKARIRAEAEQEEREFYARRATQEWIEDLAPLGTDDVKPFLTTAPWLIVVFKLVHADETHPDGSRRQVYYVNESVGIATGLLIAAIHQAGLVTLTHTPSPMGFLSTILDRPAHERPFLLLPVGYPAPDATVPDIQRKRLDQIMVVK